MARARIKDHQAEQRIFMQRGAIAAIVILALAAVLLGRLVLLQVIRHDVYANQAQFNRARKEPIPANRGLIFDRNGKVLAENQPSHQLELTREMVPDLEITLKGLVSIGVIAPEEIAEIRRLVRARRSFESVPIKLRLTQDQRDHFDVHRHQFPGVSVQSRSTRSYPHGALAVHALGYVGAISEDDLARIDRTSYVGTSLIGKMGVEKAREAELHGENGFEEILVNAQGRTVKDSALAATLQRKNPRAGSDVVLAIDLPAQLAAEEGFAGRRGAAIAIDPANGDVLVFTSLPGFDPGMFGRGITTREYAALDNSPDRPLLNRAIRGTYPPGSTVKPVLGMAGLAYGMVTAEENHYCPGVFRLPGVQNVWREGRGGVHGTVDLRTAIAESCDVYFYDLAHRLGVDKIHEFLSPFGFGKPTGIDIPSELSGILPSREYKARLFQNAKDPSERVWYAGDSVNFGIGQGFMTVTPMQLAQVTAVLAAKGAVFRPRLVTAIRNPETGETQTIDPVPLPHVKGGTPEQWNVIMEGMRATLTRGTARAIGTSADYNIAGKTGTAQAYTVSRSQRLDRQVEERLRDHSWFIAFAPAEAPRIAVAVLVENGGFGAAAAAPIVRKIMDAYLLPRLPGKGPAPAPQRDEPAAAPDEPASP